MGVVDEVPEVEVEQVEAVTSLAHKDQRANAEGAGQWVVAREAEDNAAEERHQQAVVNDGVRYTGSQPEQEENGGKAADSEEEPEQARSRNELVELGQHHPEGEAGHVRKRRVLERLQPRPVAEAVGVRNAVGVEDYVEGAGDQPDGPDDGETTENRRGPIGAPPAGHPGKQQIVERLGG